MRKITFAATMLAMSFAVAGCADDDYHSGYYSTTRYARYPIYNDSDFTARYTNGYNDRYYYGWGY
jgi:hypothetical protein